MPESPNVALPTVALPTSEPVAVTVRSALQYVSGTFIVVGIELFAYDFTEAQAKWAAAALTILLVFVQNFIEKRRGRKFIGARPATA